MLKLSARGSTVQFAARRNKSNTQKLLLLEKKLKQLHQHEPDHPYILEENVNNQEFMIKKEIAELVANKMRGAIMRSRATWETQGERPTKYFLSLEKKNFLKKTIYRLQSDNKIITDQWEILQELENFYSNLYTTAGPIDSSYITDLDMPRLTNEALSQLEMPLTLAELSLAVKELKNNKASGIDGLPIDWYKVFWNRIKHSYFSMIQESIEFGILPVTTRQGVISLLEKLDCDPLSLKSWRPPSLLNTDYKILAKVVATRLQKVLLHIIHPDQSGFIKGRHMSENIMKLLSLMEYCQKNNHSCVILTLDFEKAFDKLEWDAIYAALQKFNVGPKFLKLIKILYTEPVSCSINSGYWTKFYPLTRGVHQGDPLSALIFATTIEILGIKLRINPEIKGVSLKSYEIRNYHYADDLWLALDPTTKNIDAVLNELERFKNFSGLTINYQKSIAMILGPMRDTDAKFYTQKQLTWAHKDKAITILGYKIHPNWSLMQRVNFYQVLDKIEIIMEKWVNRSLTILRKITLVNSLISSQLMHKSMALPTPELEFFTQYKRLISKFLWGDATPKISYAQLIQKYEKGGLQLIDIEARNHALKVAWLIKWKKAGQLKDKRWLYTNLPVSNERIWEINLSQKDIKRALKCQLDMG